MDILEKKNKSRNAKKYECEKCNFVCFKKSKSLYSKTFELPLLKFTNMLMRAGKRGQTVKHVTLSFTQCFHQIIRLSNSNAFVT
jgi:hypothetical protein